MEGLERRRTGSGERSEVENEQTRKTTWRAWRSAPQGSGMTTLGYKIASSTCN